METFIMRKNLKLILLFLLLIPSISKAQNYSEKRAIRKMEIQDHKECEYLDIKETTQITNEFYWKCRVGLINRRIVEYNNTNTQKMVKKRSLFKAKIIIQNRVIKAQNQKTANSQENIGRIDHQICILRVYNPNEKSIKNSNKYNDCRENLLEERKIVKPFGRKSYRSKKEEMHYIRGVENLRNTIENHRLLKKKKEEINDLATQTMELIREFPECKKFPIKSKNFKLCTKANLQAKKCYEEMPKNIEKRKLNDKMFCKKEAVKEFPDELALYIEKDTMKTENNKKTDEDLQTNMGPKFSKGEVMALREKSYKKCAKHRIKKLKEYKKFLPIECKEMSKNWKVKKS